MKNRKTHATIAILLLLLACHASTGLAVDPVPDCTTIFFNSYFPIAGQTSMDTPCGTVRDAAKTVYEGWWKADSYWRSDPNTGNTTHGYNMNTKVYGDGVVPWFFGVVANTSNPALNMNSPRAWVNLAPTVPGTKYVPNFGGECNLEGGPRRYTPGVPIGQRYGGSGPLVDGFWTPGERFQDTMRFPGVAPDGAWAAYVPDEDFWQSSNTNDVSKTNLERSTLSTELAGRILLYPNKKDIWDKQRGEYYADYWNLSHVDVKTSIVTRIGFQNNAVIWVADQAHHTNVPFVVSDFTVAPPSIDPNTATIIPGFPNEGDFSHTAVTGAPNTAVSIPVNGIFDYNVEDINYTPLVYPARGNGVNSQTGQLWVTYQSYLFAPAPPDPRSASSAYPYLSGTALTMYRQNPNTDTTSGTPPAYQYGANNLDNSYSGTGPLPASYKLCTIYVNVYQAGELWGQPFQGPLSSPSSEFGGQGQVETYIDYGYSDFKDPNYPADDQWTGGKDHEPFEDFISWWKPTGGGGGGCWVTGVYGYPPNSTPVTFSTVTTNYQYGVPVVTTNFFPVITNIVTVTTNVVGGLTNTVSIPGYTVYFFDITNCVPSTTQQLTTTTVIFGGVTNIVTTTNSMPVMTPLAHLGPTPESVHMAGYPPNPITSISWDEYTNYITCNYPGNVTSLIARAANGTYDGPDDWGETSAGKTETNMKLKMQQHGYNILIGVASPDSGYGDTGWDPNYQHGHTVSGWWSYTYGSSMPSWMGTLPVVSEWNGNSSTCYVSVVTGTVTTSIGGLPVDVSAWSSIWYPPQQSSWGYHSPREYHDLPSSFYHNHLEDGGMYGFQVSPGITADHGSGGDWRLGESTDPWRWTINGTDKGPNSEAVAALTPDFVMSAGGPLAYNNYGANGLDAANQLNLELLTWRTDGAHLTGPKGGGRASGPLTQPPYTHDHRDVNLDGLVDLGETIPEKSQNYSVDTDSVNPTGGRLTDYPFNWQRYFEDCVAVWDQHEDFNQVVSASKRVYLEGWLCAGIGTNVSAGAGSGAGESGGPSGSLTLGPHIAGNTATIRTRDNNRTLATLAHAWPAGVAFGGANHEQGHELIHWPDYYDYNRWGQASGQGTIHMPVDMFDLMAEGGEVLGIGSTHDLAGWITPQYLNFGTAPILGAPNTGIHTIRMYPTETTPDQYFYYVNPTNNAEQFILWYKAGGSPYSGVFGGIAIEHTDGMTPNGYGAPGQQRINDRFMTAIVQADGQYHMDDGVNGGTVEDLWGQANNGIDGGPTTHFDENTLPPARWWSQTSSGLRIVDIRLPSNLTDPAEVDFEWVNENTNYYVTIPSCGAVSTGITAAATAGGGSGVAILAAGNGIGSGIGGGFFAPLAGGNRGDTDGDGLPDSWERNWFLNDVNALLNMNATTDSDGDGLPDYAEWLAQLNPRYAWSWCGYPTNQTDAAADLTGDHLGNIDKYKMGLNMREPDSDDDGWSDSQELNTAILKPDLSGISVLSYGPGLYRRVTSPSYSRSPLILRSLQLTSNDCLTIPSWEINDYTRFQTTNWTVEGWIRLNSNRETGRLVKRVTPQSGTTFEVGIATNVPYARFVTDAGNVYQVWPSNLVTATLASGTWHHVAGVFSAPNNSLRLYLDGAIAGGITALERPPPGMATLLNGSNTTGFVTLGGGFNGNVEEVRIWGSGRNAAQILKGYDKIVNNPWIPGYIVINGVQSVVTSIVNSVGNDGTLISNLRFDDGQNTNVINKLDGTVHKGGIEDWVHPLGPNEGVYWNGGNRVTTHGYCVQLAGKASVTTNIVLQLHLSNAQSMPYDDLNEDGIPDWWQVLYWPSFNPEQSGPWDGSADPNSNGVSNVNEYLGDTNPTDSSAGNGGSGGGGGVTPPPPVSNIQDSDGDGIPDFWELQYGLDPYMYDSQDDTDMDGWSNFSEYMAGTSPINTGSLPQPPIAATIWYGGTPTLGNIKIAAYSTPLMDGTPDALLTINQASVALLPVGTVVVAAPAAAGSLQLTLVSAAGVTPGTTYLQGLGLAANTLTVGATGMVVTINLPTTAAIPAGTVLTTLQPAANAYPQTFVLGTASNVVGHLREGDNYFFSYIDANNNNQWDPGEPCGYAIYQPINVGWSEVPVEINLQQNAIGFPRINWTLPNSGTRISRVQVDYGYASGTNFVYVNVADVSLRAPRNYLTEEDLVYLGKVNGMGTPTKTTDWSPRYRWSVMFDPSGSAPATYAPSTAYTPFTQYWSSASFAQPTIVSPLNEVVHLLPLRCEWTASDSVSAFTLEIRQGSATGTVVMSSVVRAPYYVGSGGIVHYVYYPQYASSQFLALPDGVYYWHVAPNNSPALSTLPFSAWSQVTIASQGGTAGSTGPFFINGELVYTGKVANKAVDALVMTGAGGTTRAFSNLSLTNNTAQPNCLPVAGSLTLRLGHAGVTNLTFTDAGANFANPASVTLVVDPSRTQSGYLSSTCVVNYVSGKILSVTFGSVPAVNDSFLASYTYQGFPFIVQAYPVLNLPGFSGRPVTQAALWQKGPFTLSGLKSGTYTLLGFVDEVGDGRLHVPDTWGFIRGSVPSSGPGYQQIGTVSVGPSIPYTTGPKVTMLDSDIDNDGLPDAWEIQKFGSLMYSSSDIVNGTTVTSVYTNTPTPAITSAMAFSPSVSIISAYGPPTPSVEAWNFSRGTILTKTVASPIVCGTTQYVCTGGVVVGNDFVQVSPTNIMLTLTNDAALTWKWQTQYQLTTTAKGSGSVTPGGWTVAGSSIVLTATAAPGALLTEWSGDTNGCGIAGNKLTVPMTQARVITASFGGSGKTLATLTVASAMAATQTVSATYGTALTQCVTAASIINGATQYVCAGGVVAGNDFIQVSPTNVTLTLTNNATLTWNWQTLYLLTTATNGSGSVTPGGWFVSGSYIVLTAKAGATTHLSGWSGNTNGCVTSNNVITVPMTQPRAITAVFAAGAAPLIAGKVTKTGTTTGMPGVTITFSGGAGTVITDGSGSYSNVVPYKWSGTATASYSSGGFATSNITYSALTANQTAKNYVWTPSPSISGKVTKTGTTNAVVGVRIAFSGGAGTVFTDGSGSYSNVVPYKWSGTATASYSSGGFATSNITYSALTASQTAKNYVWTPSPVISGKVTKTGATNGVAGVTIAASNAGGATSTDAGGNYALTVPYNWTGVVTAAAASGGTVSPGSKAFTAKLVANKTAQNFTWTAPVPSVVALAAPSPVAAITMDAVAPEDGFAQWAFLHGLDVTDPDLFDQDADGDGVSNGTEYAFGANLTKGEPVLQLLSVNGIHTAEVPLQDPATEKDAKVTVETSWRAGSGVWILAVPVATPMPDGATKQWYQALYGNAAGFRVTVQQIK